MGSAISESALATLPFVFHLADLTVWIGWKPQAARRRIFRWVEEVLVAPLGCPSEVYANLTVSQYPDLSAAVVN